MPELPEVETVKAILKKELLNRTIESVVLVYPKIITNDKDFFSKTIQNQQILDIKRKGKYLIFEFLNHVMIVHLRMEGKFFIKTNEKVLKHEHVVFNLDNKKTLRYHDTRKFGRMILLDKKDYLSLAPLNKLADEPWDIDHDLFYHKLQKRSSAIKTVLLDQTVIAGLGNIYVDETLYLSNIHPLRKANEITRKEADFIIENAGKVMKKAISLGGTTIRSYSASLGVTGLFQNELHVHTKTGTSCPGGGVVIKMKVGGRGTYVCESTQK